MVITLPSKFPCVCSFLFAFHWVYGYKSFSIADNSTYHSSSSHSESPLETSFVSLKEGGCQCSVHCKHLPELTLRKVYFKNLICYFDTIKMWVKTSLNFFFSFFFLVNRCRLASKFSYYHLPPYDFKSSVFTWMSIKQAVLPLNWDAKGIFVFFIFSISQPQNLTHVTI